MQIQSSPSVSTPVSQQTVSPGVGDFVWTLFQDLEHLHLVHTHAADSETAKTSLLAVIIKL